MKFSIKYEIGEYNFVNKEYNFDNVNNTQYHNYINF